MNSIAHHAIALCAESTSSQREQWVQLLPKGRIVTRDSRPPFFAHDLAAIIQASREYAGKAKLPIDYNHAIDLAAPKGQQSPAAGWIKGMQARDNGIWGLVEWTKPAFERITNLEYRYISPAFTHTKDGRVLDIRRAALTNNPAFEMTALASAGAFTTMDLSKLTELLGLPEDAPLDDIIAAVQSLKTTLASAQPDPSQFVPIGDFERVATELNQVKQGVSLAQAESHVDGQIRAGKLPPYLREWGVTLCQHNKPSFDGFVGRTSPALAHLFNPSVPAHAPSGGQIGNDLSKEEFAVCSALGLSAAEYKKVNGGQ